MSLYMRIFNKGLEKNPDGIAFVCDEEKYTYKQVEQKVKDITLQFQKIGIEKNSKVIIKLKNPLRFSFILLSLTYLEAIPIPVYHGLGEEKLKYMCERYDINFVIVSEDIECGIGAKSGSLAGECSVYSIVDIIDDEMEKVSIILSTSGTTSLPKAIMLTENNICSNVEGISDYLSLVENDNILLIKDLSHSSSIVGELFVGLFNGCEIVFTTKLLKVVTMVTLMQEYDITVFFAVPTLLKELMNYEKREIYNLSSLRIVNFYGASMNSSDIMNLISIFPKTNIIYSYGQTEASPRVTYIEKDMIVSHPGSCGKPIKDVRISVVNENGQECSPYEQGEIVVQGPNVMLGYYRDEKITAHVLKDGKLFTGDIAYTDEDKFLYVTGRKDNMFIRAGKNIYPEEIESVLVSHPEICEAIVEHVSNVDGMVDIIAYVVRKDQKESEVADLWNYCRSKLEDYKMPKQIKVVPYFGKTPSGKIKRNQINNIN